MLQALTRSLARRHPFADRQSKLGLTGVAFCTSVWASSVWATSQKTAAAEPALRHKLTGGAHVHLSY
eukprot:COSAG04_NODE_781_length_10327_cov_151.194466_10_plen_67_part_00